ncbi:hypothetical protein F6W79_20125 [Vibrio diabolicus]|uniref:hypothetical protein n=1 Tax=Vibrio diabolicus TaxID=50719 RepID=UPI001247095A|nr:hypothetical protein [Vibrio diabolicus]KAB0317267.1 hypothetical protein F6W79_20125 [Vibrio diabolicus]
MRVIFVIFIAAQLIGCASDQASSKVEQFPTNGSQIVKYGHWSVISSGEPNETMFGMAQAFYYIERKPTIMIGCVKDLELVYLSFGVEGYIGEQNDKVNVRFGIKSNDKDLMLERSGVVKVTNDSSSLIINSTDNLLVESMKQGSVLVYRVSPVEPLNYSNAVDLKGFNQAFNKVNRYCRNI